MENITHTDAFDLAYRFVTETNLNIFLTGKAGTGKTTFLKYLRQNSLKRMAVAAPTGVAAINAGGVTLHSLFQLPFTPFIPSNSGETGIETINSHTLLKKLHYQKQKLDLLRNLELLVIDEASMVASHTVDAIDTILKSIKRRHNIPFGGTQVLFIGDLYQLQPVVKNQEWEILKKYYPSVFFFDSAVLRQDTPVMIELNKIFRQQDNNFIEMLNSIRNNNLNEEHFNLLNSRLKKGFTSSAGDEYITLTTHNFQADELNSRKLNSLAGHLHKYSASIEGVFPEHLFPAEAEIGLKEGAQVMFLRNDTEGGRYFNGKIGVITRLDEDTIIVKCQPEPLREGEKEPIEILVNKQIWKNINYSIDANTREIKEEETGSFEQYPLRLAWAITIHKSQGLTFDKLIIDAENAFANGQVYVALSRCTTLNGLVLTSPVNQRFLGAHQNLKDWEEKNHDDGNLVKRFYESRQAFISQELENIFTWNQWLYLLRELQVAVDTEKENTAGDIQSWLKSLMEKQSDFQKVSLKFLERMRTLKHSDIGIEENSALQQRLKDAAHYFAGEIEPWHKKFINHPIRVKNRKLAGKFDKTLQEINIFVAELLHKLNCLKSGFLLNDFLKNSKKLSAKPPYVLSSYSNNKSYISEGGMPQYSGLYAKLNKFRQDIAIENGTLIADVFKSSQIEKICENLPADKESLLSIKGINKKSISQYANNVVEIVLNYCRENKLEPRKVERNDSIKKTVSLLVAGKTIEQIAAERNFVTGTIESHLAKAIDENLITIEQVMTMSEIEKIAAFFPPKGKDVQLSEIKERVPTDVTWGKLRMVQSWLQKGK